MARLSVLGEKRVEQMGEYQIFFSSKKWYILTKENMAFSSSSASLIFFPFLVCKVGGINTNCSESGLLAAATVRLA